VEAFSDAMRFEVAGFGVKVVVVEPGLITTNFDQAAVASMDLEDTGPYGEFNRTVASATQDVYRGPMKRMGGPPEAVAKVIEKALTARRPRSRYRVTPSATMSITTRRLMPDRAWDAAMRTTFKQPRG
jgi:short-subunit dehydrogenase